MAEPEGAVVVGVDGSPGSSHALAWAAGEARLRGTRLRVVHGWTIPTMVYPSYLPPDVFTEMPAEARRQVDAQVAEVLGPAPDVPVDLVVEEGRPAEVVIEAAKGADLVVVGTRGRGGFAGLLLGSVSSQVAHHAPCPVVIVP
jgi:nucleotide-binding universal stress UspA family protein